MCLFLPVFLLLSEAYFVFSLVIQIKSAIHIQNITVKFIFFLLLEPQGSSGSQVPQNKYAELLAIIEELGKEIRPTYAGSKSAMERLKRGNCKPSNAEQFK